jgi:hypothetical protein
LYLIQRFPRQKKFDQKKNAVMWIAFFGGILVLVIVENSFGRTASGLCGIVGIVWYLLGYNYCEALWCKEREMTEYREALIEYEKLHPDSA